MQLDHLPSEIVAEVVTEDDHGSRLAAAQYLLERIHEQIAVADEKINVLFGGSALLAAALAFDLQNELLQLISGRTSLLGSVAVMLHVGLLACVAYAMTSAILALLPRIQPGHTKASLFFFGRIATMPHDAFVKEFGSLSDAILLPHVLSQVHTNSQIVSIKYRWIRRAAIAFCAAILVLLVKQGLALFM